MNLSQEVDVDVVDVITCKFGMVRIGFFEIIPGRSSGSLKDPPRIPEVTTVEIAEQLLKICPRT